jgi:hypothetical protein
VTVRGETSVRVRLAVSRLLAAHIADLDLMQSGYRHHSSIDNRHELELDSNIRVHITSVALSTETSTSWADPLLVPACTA